MQFGIFTVGDVTADPTTGRTPSEAERIRAVVAIAKKAEEVGLDVFALGEHHNPPFFSSSPTTTLAYLAAQTTTLQLSTATTLITTNDPVKIAEDYAMLQPPADGRAGRLTDPRAAPAHRHHADHPQRPGEDRRGLRDAAAPGRRPGGPDDGPRQHRPGLPAVRAGHPQRPAAGGGELP